MKKYHLLVPATTIHMEEFVVADGYWIEHGAYYFFKFEGDHDSDCFRNRVLQCAYPVNLTIIKSIKTL